MKISFVLKLVLLAINTGKLSANEYSYCQKNVESHSATLRLRRHLFCDYDYGVRPANSNSTVMVNFGLFPKFIEFDDWSNTLTIHAWMSLLWKDLHLQWTPQEHDGLKSIHVFSDEVWVPDIAVYNSGDMGIDQNSIPRTQCLLMSSGTVACVPAIKYVSRCAAEFRQWPFDKQNCTLRLGSWMHTGEEIDYRLFNSNGINMVDFTPNPQWKILSINATKKVHKYKGAVDTFPSLFFNIMLERHSTVMKTTVVVPAILLIIMTLSVMWLNPMTSERMGLAALNLICHFLCIIDVNWQVPQNGANTPSILIFHHNSMVIASLVLFLTVFLRQIKEMSISAPGWLTSTTSVILQSRAGQIFLLTTLDPKAPATLGAEDDNAGLVSGNLSSVKTNPGGSDAWHHFATLIDRLFFIGVVLTYIIMLIVFLPNSDINNNASDVSDF